MAVMDFEFSKGENVVFPIETHCSTSSTFLICMVTYDFFSFSVCFFKSSYQTLRLSSVSCPAGG